MERNDDHLSCAQFLLLKFDLGLTVEEKLMWRAHLQSCSFCKNRFDEFDDHFDQQAPIRKNVDIDLITDLMAFKERELPAEPEAFLQAMFQRLLQIDEATRSMLTFPSLEEVRQLPIAVPDDLNEKIYEAITPRWEALSAKLKSSLTQIIEVGEKTIAQFIIEIAGFRPALAGATLLDKESLLIERGIPIQHKGGDLQFQVGRPHIKVELYSQETDDERFLLVAEAISNQEGIIRFEGIWKGDYRLLILGDTKVLGVEESVVT